MTLASPSSPDRLRDRCCCSFAEWSWSRVIDDASAAARGTVGGVSALRFNVVYEDAGEGWVYAHVSELPEVQTQGEGLEQARAMVLEAIAMVLEERRARGELIPKPGWALVESVEIAA
jgi:predicted RNase H-like HicB family nuclease